MAARAATGAQVRGRSQLVERDAAAAIVARTALGIRRWRLGGPPAIAGFGKRAVDVAALVGGVVTVGSAVSIHSATSNSVRSRARASASVDLTVPSAQRITAAVSATVRPTK